MTDYRKPLPAITPLERPFWDYARRHELRMQPGYDHSYYFVATFLADHFSHHAAALS